MPLLRGHHLICLHFFNGEGYDEAFIKNLRDTLELASEGEIIISSGVDDVCAGCSYLKEDRCRYSENADKEILEMDKKALELLDHSHNDKVRWNELENKIPGIFPEWFSLYCRECDWKKACEKNSFYRKFWCVIP